MNFSENLFYKNSILKPCLSPSSLCKVLDSRGINTLTSSSQVQLPWLSEFSPTPPGYIEGELLCWQPLVFAFE